MSRQSRLIGSNENTYKDLEDYFEQQEQREQRYRFNAKASRPRQEHHREGSGRLSRDVRGRGRRSSIRFPASRD